MLRLFQNEMVSPIQVSRSSGLRGPRLSFGALSISLEGRAWAPVPFPLAPPRYQGTCSRFTNHKLNKTKSIRCVSWSDLRGFSEVGDRPLAPAQGRAPEGCVARGTILWVAKTAGGCAWRQ